jgi:16S rRNA (guanine527-N7)-methyltransferase
LNQQVLIDVGSGAGFPGLPLKILYPGLRLTLLESIAKKVYFLHELIAALEIENVIVIADRAENLGHDPAHREKYDWAVARAVAHLSPLLEYLLPFCRVGGFVLAQKGIRVQEELSESRVAISLLGGGTPHLIPIHLPEQNEACLVVVEKLIETPAKYPRRAGMPTKRPL